MNAANSAFYGQLNRVQNTSYTNINAINNISHITQDMANAYAYNGIMQAMQVSMNYGCAPGGTMIPAIGTFLSNIQTSKDSVNQQISAVKENKTSQYHQHQAWLKEQERILAKAREAQRSNQNTSTAWGARNSIGIDTFYFDDSYKGDLTAAWQASNAMGIDTFYFDDSYRADLAYYIIERLRPLYENADDAAKAFSEEVYSASMYIQHEYATCIYALTVDGKTMYSYTPPLSGTTHNSIGRPFIPKGATVEAFAHTHPKTNEFSDPDRTNVNNSGVKAYVVGPNRELLLLMPDIDPRRYDVPPPEGYSPPKPKPIDIISPVPLTNDQQVSLVEEYQESWDSHLASGCSLGCCDITWPVL